jgi:hypothetical protein
LIFCLSNITLISSSFGLGHLSQLEDTSEHADVTDRRRKIVASHG